MTSERSLFSVLNGLRRLIAKKGSAYSDNNFKQYWMPDSACKECYDCGAKFTVIKRKHHCRICGQVFCSLCTSQYVNGQFIGYKGELRCCDYCVKVVKQCVVEEDFKLLNLYSTTSNNEQPSLMLEKLENETYENSQHLKTSLFDVKCNNSEGETTSNFDNITDEADENVEKRKEDTTEAATEIVNAIEGLVKKQMKDSPTDQCQEDKHNGLKNTFKNISMFSENNHINSNLNQDKPRFYSNLLPSSIASLPAIDKEDSAPSDYIPNKGTSTFNELKQVYRDHLKRLIKQLIKKAKLDENIWQDVIMSVCKTVCEKVDVKLNSSMDVRNNVKIKKVLEDGGSEYEDNRGEWLVLDGLAMSKTLTNKHMLAYMHALMEQRAFNQSRGISILLVDTPLQYQRLEAKISSFEPQILQEKTYLENLTQRLITLQPDIVVSSKNVAWVVQEQFKRHNVALIVNVKKENLLRLNRLVGGSIITSVDGMLSGTELGKCYDITFNHFTFKNRSKTLTFIKGLEPGHYTSVIIKGRSLEELVKVKRCIKFVIYAFHHLKAELSLLSTLSACIPSHVLLNYQYLNDNFNCSSDDNNNQSYNKCQVSTGGVNEDVNNDTNDSLLETSHNTIVSISPFFYTRVPKRLNKNDAGENGDIISSNNLDVTKSYNHNSSMESLSEFIYEDEDSSINDNENSEETVDAVKEPTSDLFKHNFVVPFSHNIVFKNMLSEYRAQGCRGVYEDPIVVKLEDDDNINNHYNKEINNLAFVGAHGFEMIREDVFVDKNEELTIEKIGETTCTKYKITKRGFDENTMEKNEYDDKKEIDCMVYTNFAQKNDCQGDDKQSLSDATNRIEKINDEIKNKSKKRKKNLLDITKHQGISILFYSFSKLSANSPSPCVNPWIVTMDFYSGSDIALGMFLHRYCFNNSYKCVNSRCDSSMLTHIRRFVQGNGCVEVSLCKDQPFIDHPSLPSNYASVSSKSPNHNIFVWTYCDVCNKSSKKFIMGKEVYHISLGKYLEMRLNECTYQSAINNDDANEQGTKTTKPSSQLTLPLNSSNSIDNQKANKECSTCVNIDKSVPAGLQTSKHLNHSQTAPSFSHQLCADHQVSYASNSQCNDKSIDELSNSLKNLSNILSILPHSECYHSINQDQTHIFQCKSTQVSFKHKRVGIYSIEYPATNIPASTYPCQVLIEEAVLLRNRLEELFEKITEAISRVCKDSIDATYSPQLKTDKGSLMDMVVLMEDTIGELQDAEHYKDRKLLYEEVLKLQLKIRKTINSIVKIWNDKLNAAELKKAKTNVGLLKNQHSIPEDSLHEATTNEDKDTLAQETSTQQQDNQTQNKIFMIQPDNIITKNSSQLSSSLPQQQVESIEQHQLSSSQPSSSYLASNSQLMPQQKISMSPSLSEHSEQPEIPLQTSPDVTEDVLILDNESKLKSKVTESFSETTAKVKQMITNFLLPSSSIAIQDPNPADEHSSLEGVENIVVHEAEFSSIIAFALSSQQYKEKLAETCKNTNDNTDNMPSFQEKQSVSFIKSKTSKAPKRQPKTKSSSSPIKATSSSSSSVGYADDNFENVDSVKYTPNDVEEFGGDDEIEAEIISIPKESKQKQPKTNHQNEHLEISFSDASTKFTCKIYYAYKFSQLRSVIMGEEKGFIHSLSRSRSWKGGGGKSGSNFNKTRDNRFFLKQMSAREVQSFTEFAPMYIQHINQCYANQMTSTLAKIVGVYRIEIEKLTNTKAPASVCEELLVIENLFCNQSLNQIYDLKGSTRNRLADTRMGRYNNVLLDENLIKNMLDQPWYTKERSKEHLMAFLQRDTLFLCKHSVMDYSLLVGVDDVSGRLVVGIIDYIRTFTWDKKMEMLFKTTYAKKMPTVQDPEAYKTRFLDSMKKYFMDVPSHQCTRHYL